MKLSFASPEAARQAVQALGARLEQSRRLLDDLLFDTVDGTLRRSGRALRLRRDGTRAVLTVKGPGRAGPVKSREEIEVTVADADTAEALLRLLGYRPSFRCQKYREEYASDGATVTVDETPIGTFVEIEGDIAAIDRIAAALGRSRADYQVDSYARLYQVWCRARGVEDSQMVFQNLRSDDR